MRDRDRCLLGAVFCLAVLFLAAPLGAQDSNSDSHNLFETKIRPVLAMRCYVCHSAKAAKVQGGLLVDSQAGLKRGGNSGAVIEPGDPDKSLLVRALRYQDKDLQMPPGKPLPAAVVAELKIGSARVRPCRQTQSRLRRAIRGDSSGRFNDPNITFRLR